MNSIVNAKPGLKSTKSLVDFRSYRTSSQDLPTPLSQEHIASKTVQAILDTNQESGETVSIQTVEDAWEWMPLVELGKNLIGGPLGRGLGGEGGEWGIVKIENVSVL